MEDNRTANYEVNQIDLFEIIAGCITRVRKIWWLLLLILSLCTAVNTVREKLQYSPQYEASASFIVSTGGKEYVSFSSYYNRVTMDQLSATFPYVIMSGVLNNIVAEDMGLAYVPGSISASVLEETNLFQIKVTSSEAQMAYDILQSVIKNYPQVAKYVIGDTVLTLIDETGVPEAPTNPLAYTNAAVQGFLIGAIICIVIVVLQVLMRNTVKNQDDLKSFMNVKFLAGIPKERVGKRSKKKTGKVLVDDDTSTPVFREALHTLQIRFARVMDEKKYKTVVISSALAGEGKTTISCNLAYALAGKGHKVLLIDGDLRNPSVAELLNLDESEMGIANVLKGDISVDKVIQQYQDTTLWVLAGTKPVENVSRLYRNGRMRDIVEDYSEKMDYIIIDTPPCGIMNDASLVADYSDAVLMVIRQDFARKEKILDGLEMMSSSKASMIGCVINGEDVGSGSYGKYGYGKYGYGRYGYGKYGNGRYGHGGYGYKERTRK